MVGASTNESSDVETLIFDRLFSGGYMIRVGALCLLGLGPTVKIGPVENCCTPFIPLGNQTHLVKKL